MGQDLIKEYTLSASYSQEMDCCSTEDDYQDLSIETCDGGGGPFYIIKTKRWAFDKPEEFYALIDEFIEKFKKLNDGESG